ncbi:MAG: 50S ribosomal protein L11 methyltransferase [Deltaproteobacteria bacterium]|nr:50S ribosomal protein L11 methyltransferase [Deltaproteobacteria bacterium]
MEYYFFRYGDLELHRRMVSDRRRTRAFADALFEVVSNESSVLDVGTGTGILAMLAARAGARRVYAVDFADIVDVARKLVAANGLDDTIKVIRAPAEELMLEERVDILVSEWLGNFALVESMLEDVLHAREKNLKPGGRMIPASVSLILAPLDDAVTYADDGPGFWRNPIHGLDLSQLEAWELAQGKAWQRHVEPGSLLAQGQPIVSLELARATMADTSKEGRVTYVARRDGVLNAFCGWFSAELTERITLDTGPGQGPTHWAQTYVPFPPRVVRKGQPIEVQYALGPDPRERRNQRLMLRVDGVEQVCCVE